MIWLFTLIFMLLVVAGMAIGVMAGRKPIAGSCAGLANSVGLDHTCHCGKAPGSCGKNAASELGA
ncbi:(Na+)-NQR maturation NqrM [Allofranklinella schreckenbergeri]|uniref:(Na+)-NQR maturation NqrM n=1 Tax=Allofranklinella schreckenbergeri TaxID=1076744 RepID=A0A3M6PR84_9BURK|nr:(Na+)-NQR maturation NqrM [Allofranklinella schreckenbergeri]RMW93126.1 (Na+)-NQR maturation NqrM [Allofranklinella schreckenbergeri]